MFLFAINSTFASQIPDTQITIHQKTLNKFLGTLGPVSDKMQTTILGKTMTYRWTVTNPTIQIHEGNASFKADVKVDSKYVNYNTKATGKALITYNKLMNKIKLKIDDVSFELKTKAFRIGNMDISSFYNPEFELDGPKSLNSSMDFKMPNGQTKKVYIAPLNTEITLIPEFIILSSDLRFTEIN